MNRTIAKVAALLLRRTPAYVWYWEYQFKQWSTGDERARTFYSQFLRDGDLCFDIGANLGQRTKIFRRIGATAVAVEPQAQCMRVLRALYEKDPSVHLVQKAIGASDGEAEMLINESANSLSSLSSDYVHALKTSGRETNVRWNRRTMVQVTSLDSLIRQYGRPAFIKIDVEGYELEVLKGLSSSVSALSFEFTPEFLTMAQDCVLRLSKLGMSTFNLSLGETMDFHLKDWIGAEEMARMLSGRSGDASFLGDIYARATHQ
jgi:FkbM family methyltransferase